jgi:hypothetical protein
MHPASTPALFWWYLAVVYLLFFAAVVTSPAWLNPPGWPLQIPVAGVISLVDVIAAPALIYAWLWRSRPITALLGAFSIVLVGALASGAWIGSAGVREMFALLPSGKWMLILGLASAVVAYEVRVLVEVAGLWRHSNFDQAIAESTRTGPGEPPLRRWFNTVVAVELRFWAYGLISAQPSPHKFAGRLHFSYAGQSGNAQTWIAWAVINAAPTPLIHALLHQASPAAAALTTAATLLSSLWCFAEARAAKHRPVSLDGEWLYLRYGLMVDRKIALSQVRSAGMLDWKDMDARGISHYAGCGAANLRLVLSSGETIHIGLDDPNRFLAALCSGPEPQMGQREE